MADKSKNKKDNEEYDSDGSVVVYRVDNERGKGKVPNKDGGNTFFVRKVTDERWETNLPDPLWLADMVQGGCHAKPPCEAFPMDPFDIMNMMQGGLGVSPENGDYVVIYESDDPKFNDIDKLKKGNKMRKLNYLQNGGYYVPYAQGGANSDNWLTRWINALVDNGITRRINKRDKQRNSDNMIYTTDIYGHQVPMVQYTTDENGNPVTDDVGVVTHTYIPIATSLEASSSGAINTGNYGNATIDGNLSRRGGIQTASQNGGSGGASASFNSPNGGGNISVGINYEDIANAQNAQEERRHNAAMNKIQEDDYVQDLLAQIEELQNRLDASGGNNRALRREIDGLKQTLRQYIAANAPELDTIQVPIDSPIVITPAQRRGGRFQQGGQMSQQQLMQQIVALVQAAMQGNQEAQDQISQIAQAAENGDQQAQQIYSMIQQVAQKMQGAQSARRGGKFNYIHQLRTGVSPQQRIVFNRQGGRLVRSVVDSRRTGGRLQAPKRKYINYFG